MNDDTDLIQVIIDFLKKEVGITYSSLDSFHLKARLNEAIKSLGHENLSDFCNEIKSGIDNIRKQAFIDLMTNNETSFFRDKNVFQLLETRIFPEIAKANHNIIKIWSAASSYGQEPCSLSMIISEIEEKTKSSIHCSINATDVSSQVLKRAQRGLYSQLEVQRGLSTMQMMKYFEAKDDGWWKFRSKELSRIKYNKLNLQEPFDHLEQYDLILCRNVLIYQSMDGKKGVINRLFHQIKEGGYLVLGSGESLLGLSDQFQLVKDGPVILYQKRPSLSGKAAA